MKYRQSQQNFEGTSWQQTLVEILLLSGLFWLWGGWPVPDVNEQYYIGKAIHFWHRDWLPADHFLDTPDSHWLFYATFGIFSFLFSPIALAWFGRFFIWILTAWSWLYLSRTFFRPQWMALITVTAFLFYLDAFHLAGEWVIGGVEGKGFSFPFVFWGLANFCRARFRWAWVYLGIASAFHVLVGGWTIIACLIAWLLKGLFGHLTKVPFSARRKKLLTEFFGFFPFLLLGLLLSLPGLVPALLLDSNASTETIHRAHQIYVFERLAHHLVPSTLPWVFIARFGLLVGIWFLICSLGGGKWNGRFSRLHYVVFSSILIAGVGLTLDFGSLLLIRWGYMTNQLPMAEILRFYLFRLSDWAVPLGTAFGSVFLFLHAGKKLLPSIEQAEKIPKDRLGGWFLSWGLISIVLYGVFKTIFIAWSNEYAKRGTIDPTFPALSRPVVGVSFLATLLCLGTILLLLYWRQRSNRFQKNPLARMTQHHGAKLVGPLLLGTIFFSGVLALMAPGYYFLGRLELRSSPVIPRSNPQKASISNGWLDMCRYVRDPANTEPNASFLVPRGCDSFKWNAHRAEIGSWKEIPQDAASIVEWYAKMETLYTVPGSASSDRWNQPLVIVLISKGRARVQEECRQYGIDYLIIENPPYVIGTNEKALQRYKEFFDNDLVYQNDQFTLLKMKILTN